MSARFENAIAWALSEPDSEKRKLTTSNLSPLIERLGKVVSLDYSGEPDMASMTASDIRYCINRFFPIRIKDSNERCSSTTSTSLRAKTIPMPASFICEQSQNLKGSIRSLDYPVWPAPCCVAIPSGFFCQKA